MDSCSLLVLGASCCVGWSVICAIVLFIIATVYYLRWPIGEALTDEEYQELAKANLLGGVIWIVAGVFSAFMYVRQMKKEEARRAAEANQEEANPSSTSS